MRRPAGYVLLAALVLACTCGAEAEEAQHWSYRPLASPTVPAVANRQQVRNAIDGFVIRGVEAEGGRLAAEADPVALLRRVTFDLIGLPPSREEVAEYLRDDRPDRYERLVDRLLASPHYGEKWASEWLDLCHYADTDGYLTDQIRPVAWRYRAWLVDSLNRNQPFDEFTIEQLAGDLLPNATPQQKVATGFLRQTLSNREGGAEPEEFRVKQVIDRTSMLGQVWMGLTVGCAQCHDHKYDQISQEEFFQLYAFMDSADEINLDVPLPSERAPYEAALPEYHRRRRELLAPYEAEIAALQRRWEARLLEARRQPGKDWFWDRQWEVLGLVWGGNLGEGQLEGQQIVLLDASRRTRLQHDRLLDYFLGKADTIDAAKVKELKLGELRAKLAQLQAELPPVTRAATMMQTQTPRPVFVHIAGDFRDRGYPVEANTPAVLPPLEAERPDRLALARWLVSPRHPLTARVAVNRMWQAFFGRGLVATPADFGVRGAAPSHPELLDWLASQYIQSGWDRKAMHRTLVCSATYRQSSVRGQRRGEGANDGGRVDDPSVARVARPDRFVPQRPLRLTAEQLRDAALRASGLWDSRIGGPSVKPPQPESVSKQSYHNTWEPSEGGDRYRRAIYTWIQRTSPFAMHIVFDAPNPNHVCARRDRSNTPLQALTLLNDPVFYGAAAGLARRVLREPNLDDSQRIARAFEHCLARTPTDQERKMLLKLLGQLREESQSEEARGPGEASSETEAETLAWTTLCSVLFNVHEFVTRP